MKNKKISILCIDALKPEHIEYMPYLKSLTQVCSYGRLIPNTGFMSADEIFFNGNSNILAFFLYNPDSCIKWASKFKFLEAFGKFGRFFLNIIINIFLLIKNKHIMLTYNIPIKKLKYFDTEVKSIKKNADYIYINKLDKLQHKFGVFSIEVIRYLKKLDDKLKKIKFDVLFSDHGMINVDNFLKVPESKICFIDSTMARYWGNEDEIKIINEKLPLKFGKIIKWPDERYGNLIFIADKGNLILPNYWQGKNKLKAMHGYDSKNKEMQGFYLLKQKGKRKDIKIEELHKIYKRIILSG